MDTKYIFTMLNSPIVDLISLVLLILYVETVGNKIPNPIIKLMKNPIIQIGYAMLCFAYVGPKNMHIALIMSLFFVITLQLIHNKETLEQFEYLEKYMNTL
jgi:hypothetical protein